MRKDTEKNINFVVKNNLCCKCGMCYSVCPENAIDIKGEIDRIPVVNYSCKNCGMCVNVCPGHEPAIIKKSESLLGDFVSCYVGYSFDQEIRFSASSGGIVTSLNIFLLEQMKFDGVVCIIQSQKNIFENKVVLAKNKQELLLAMGSRYSPAFLCRGIKDLHLENGKKYSIVGKPCDIQAIQKYIGLRNKFTLLKIAIFCAHTPCMTATQDILNLYNIDEEKIKKINYRGHGWPGYFTVFSGDKIEPEFKMKYRELWDDILCKSKYQNKRCFLCHDCTGEFADFSVGDAWIDDYIDKSPGHSVVIARNNKSQSIILEAVSKKYLVLDEAAENLVIQSQMGLLWKKLNIRLKRIIGRILFEKMTDENIRFIYKKSHFRSIPGIIKFYLIRKFSTWKVK